MPRTMVLGLSIGTRNVGAAILDKYGHLKVKMIVFPGKWNEEKLEGMLQKLKKELKVKNIQALCLKIPPSSHHSDNLLSLLDLIKRYCIEQNVTLHICTIKELTNQNRGLHNKKMLIRSLARRHPILVPYAQKEFNNRHQHYTKMFEAVAAAELFLEQLQKNI